MKWTTTRLKELKRLFNEGNSYREIGKILGMTGAGVYNAAVRHGVINPERYSKTERRLKRTLVARRKKFYSLNMLVDTEQQTKIVARIKDMYARKKQNAKNLDIKFTIKFSDILWPTHCPILKTKLDYFCKRTENNAPSFDRINSKKGYIKGNVQIISARANRLKNNATLAEIRAIENYMHSFSR